MSPTFGGRRRDVLTRHAAWKEDDERGRRSNFAANFAPTHILQNTDNNEEWLLPLILGDFFSRGQISRTAASNQDLSECSRPEVEEDGGGEAAGSGGDEGGVDA